MSEIYLDMIRFILADLHTGYSVEDLFNLFVKNLTISSQNGEFKSEKNLYLLYSAFRNFFENKPILRALMKGEE